MGEAAGDHVGPPGAMKAFPRGLTDEGGSPSLAAIDALAVPEFTGRRARFAKMDEQGFGADGRIYAAARHVLCGSDYPHPEGLLWPAEFAEEARRPRPLCRAPHHARQSRRARGRGLSSDRRSISRR
jgi:hypothetical protein